MGAVDIKLKYVRRIWLDFDTFKVVFELKNGRTIRVQTTQFELNRLDDAQSQEKR